MGGSIQPLTSPTIVSGATRHWRLSPVVPPLTGEAFVLTPRRPDDSLVAYQGICRFVWRRPWSATSAPALEPILTPSSIIASMFSALTWWRNAIPAPRVAASTRDRASTRT